jgi:hypothetical protein
MIGHARKQRRPSVHAVHVCLSHVSPETADNLAVVDGGQCTHTKEAMHALCVCMPRTGGFSKHADAPPFPPSAHLTTMSKVSISWRWASSMGPLPTTARDLIWLPRNAAHSGFSSGPPLPRGCSTSVTSLTSPSLISSAACTDPSMHLAASIPCAYKQAYWILA